MTQRYLLNSHKDNEKTHRTYLPPQRRIKPLWKRLADGCHPDRETWKAIEHAGFDQVEIEHFRLSLPVVGPHIAGTAVK